MSALPIQTVTDLQRQTAEDAAALLLADFGVDALYKPVGAADWLGTPVRIYKLGKNCGTLNMLHQDGR